MKGREGSDLPGVGGRAIFKVGGTVPPVGFCIKSLWWCVGSNFRGKLGIVEWLQHFLWFRSGSSWGWFLGWVGGLVLQLVQKDYLMCVRDFSIDVKWSWNFRLVFSIIDLHADHKTVYFCQSHQHIFLVNFCTSLKLLFQLKEPANTYFFLKYFWLFDETIVDTKYLRWL